MSLKFVLRVGLLLLTVPLSSQSLEGLLPSRSLARAGRLLASMDSAGQALESRLAAARKAQLKAEAEAVESYALLGASRSTRGSWAAPEGLPRSGEASAAYGQARDAAKAAALLLAARGDRAGSDEGLRQRAALEASLKAGGDSLAALVLEPRLSDRAALGLEKNLSARAHDLGRLFPEAVEIEALLNRAGSAGSKEAAAAMARRSPEAVASALLASRSRLLALSPGASGPLARLEDSFSAYRSWLSVFAIAAYPGDLASISPEQRSALAASLGAVLELGQARAASLFAAMSLGGARDEAAADAAVRLATAWARSPASGRRNLAALCGLRESSLSLFSSMLASRPARALSRSASADALAAMSALNSLEIAIADEETLGDQAGAFSRAAEPALLLLEKPELATTARLEERYAKLYAEASRRLQALYAQAAESAQARLESSGPVFRAASQALGSAPTDLVVHALDLGLPQGESGRRIAFFAVATDSGGASVCIPLRAELAGEEYAAAFARAAGLNLQKSGAAKPDLPRGEAPALLGKYGQAVLTVYDPEGSGDELTVDYFPRGGELAHSISAGISLLGDAELELALLEGWQP